MATQTHTHTHREFDTITLGITPLFLIVAEVLLVSDPITRSLCPICHVHIFSLLVLLILFLTLFILNSYEFFRLLVVDFVVNPPFDLPPVLPFFLFVGFPSFLRPSFHPPFLSFSPALTDFLMSSLPSSSIINHFFYSTIPTESLS